MKIIGYCRVSSRKQVDNNSFEQQKQEILSKYENAVIYQEQFTGKTTHRPILEEAISKLNEGDMLVVTKLDRLARNTEEGIQLIKMLFAKGISVHVLNVGLLENTTMGQFFITTMLAVAEMERSLIIERMQAGKEIAKQDPDYREGRPKKFTKKQLQHAYELKQQGNSYKQVELMTGICKQTLWRYIKSIEQTQKDCQG